MGEVGEQKFVHGDAHRVEPENLMWGGIEFEQESRERGPRLRAVVGAGEPAEVAIPAGIRPDGSGVAALPVG
jgi:hypothetical protein